VPVSSGQRVTLLFRHGRNPNVIIRDLLPDGRNFSFDLTVQIGGPFVGQQDDAAALKFLHLG
jgi:hypothetical protein